MFVWFFFLYGDGLIAPGRFWSSVVWIFFTWEINLSAHTSVHCLVLYLLHGNCISSLSEWSYLISVSAGDNAPGLFCYFSVGRVLTRTNTFLLLKVKEWMLFRNRKSEFSPTYLFSSRRFIWILCIFILQLLSVFVTYIFIYRFCRGLSNWQRSKNTIIVIGNGHFSWFIEYLFHIYIAY